MLKAPATSPTSSTVLIESKLISSLVSQGVLIGFPILISSPTPVHPNILNIAARGSFWTECQVMSLLSLKLCNSLHFTAIICPSPPPMSLWPPSPTVLSLPHSSQAPLVFKNAPCVSSGSLHWLLLLPGKLLPTDPHC